jgi:uncharacterized protein (DUF433 family)
VVELSRRYSNHPQLLEQLATTWQRLETEQWQPTVDEALVPKSAGTRPHALSRRLTPVAVAALLADYQAGASSLELARRYGVGKASVLALLDRHNVPRRHQPMTQQQVARPSLYESGLSVAAVSNKLGVPARTVHRTLQRAGVQMRDTHGRPRSA